MYKHAVKDDLRFIPGQRWVSDTESDLGLGLIAAVDGRMVTVYFPASEEQRTYAANNAPLSRLSLNVGEMAQSTDDWEMQVQAIHEVGGLLVYTGTRADTGHQVQLAESQINSFIQLADAKNRLLNGQIDSNKWFDIRVATRNRQDQVQSLENYGLSGARISLIPHQLFIAQEVGRRFAPRALLADEVGLGKTIEACLILHKQLLTGRARRALIIVPEALLHQWLVELLRRFNLRFKLFDAERCSSIQEQDRELNPFDTEQLVLSPLSLFESEQRQQEALLGNWDLVIIDEAHHVQWHEDAPSPEFRFVSNLSRSVPGLLLLTATPEQLGEDSHFARLNLLDPDRFADFEDFVQEQRDYRAVSTVVDELMSTKGELSPASQILVGNLLNEETGISKQSDRDSLVKKLIDRHGPSRVLFRNTRANIKGFSKRVAHPTPLTNPDQYDISSDTIEQALHPELTHPRSWVDFDPRVAYVVDKLQLLKTKKILLICALASTAIELERALRTRHGIHSAVFHEKMSVVARDRAAHFFADAQGARLLICSEIGSEGRNFQFSHHLILFDLPLHPDLLEQRIGRLDRIGQSEDIQIHIPYLRDSAQATLFKWHHQGMNAFNQTCPVGQSVYMETREELLQALSASTAPKTLFEKTRRIHAEKVAALEQGRDHLLEISSFDRDAASTVVDSIKFTETNLRNMPYMVQIFDAYGVEFEDKHERTFIVRPSEHMQTAHFPFLKSDGMTVTFDRATALAHEDVEYLTWEHPMTQGAMDLVLIGDHGKTAVVGVEFDLLPRGSLLVETSHVLEIAAPNASELRRFLGSTVCQYLKDGSGRDFSKLLGSTKLFHRVRDVERSVVKGLIHMKRETIAAVIKQNELEAKSTFNSVIEAGKSRLTAATELELDRLAYLRSVNASVRREEVDLVQAELHSSLNHLSNTQPRLDGVRLIVTL